MIVLYPVVSPEGGPVMSAKGPYLVPYVTLLLHVGRQMAMEH